MSAIIDHSYRHFFKYCKSNYISSTSSLVVAKSLGEQFVERSHKVMVTLFAKLANDYVRVT